MNTVIYGVLEEEKQRNLERQEITRQEIESLRKGTIVLRNISGKEYYYLRYRKGNKIKNDYIGKVCNKEKLDNIKYELEKRKYLLEVLRKLKLEYKQISKIVKD